MASAASRRICRRSSCCPAAATAAAWPIGRADFCRRRLPACRCGRKGDPILNVSSPAGIDARTAARDDRPGRRDSTGGGSTCVGDPEIATRIAAYEMAYRLQTLGAGTDGHRRREPGKRSDMYGAEPGKASFANNCLLARRLVERGRAVRQHLSRRLGPPQRRRRGTAHPVRPDRQAVRRRLIKDLKQRGLLDDTLVVWGGEFGRTPMVESNAGAGPQAGPRSSSAGLHHVAGRRRRQAGHDAWARPTNWAFTSSKTRSTSTTCKPRSCTCSASTTSG